MLRLVSSKFSSKSGSVLTVSQSSINSCSRPIAWISIRHYCIDRTNRGVSSLRLLTNQLAARTQLAHSSYQTPPPQAFKSSRTVLQSTPYSHHGARFSSSSSSSSSSGGGGGGGGDPTGSRSAELKVFGWLVLAGAVGFIYGRYVMDAGGETTADQTNAYLIERRRADRLLPNYSPALEDRFVEPPGPGTFTDQEYFALPSTADRDLLSSISPGLADQDYEWHMKLMGDRERLFDDSGVNAAAVKQAQINGPPSRERSLKLVEQGKKDLRAGHVFLLSARMLNELAISLRLQGKTEEAKAIARKSQLRNEEAALLFQSTSDTFQQCQPSDITLDVYLDLQNLFTESCMRKHEWKVMDELIAIVLNSLTSKPTQPLNDSQELYEELLQYQTLELQAESLQLRKRYADAIPIWQQVIQHSKRPFTTAAVGIRNLTVLDFTNQLSHCYLQVNDLKRAWSTYELGLEVERIGRDCLSKQETDVKTQEWVRTEAERFTSARADAEIMKRRILEKNNGKIPA